jgi:ComF family protein
MFRWLRRFQHGVGDLANVCQDLLLPPHCAYCGISLSGGHLKTLLCEDCRSLFGPATWNGCKRCGGSSRSGLAVDRCALCKDTSLRFDSVIPLGGYHSGLRDAIYRMKRPSHDALSLALGQLLAERRRQQLVEVQADMIVPIPMFWTRQLRRGKNGPELLAGCLSKSLKIPTFRLLSRCRNTPPQSSQPPSRRFDNIRGAFAVRRPACVKNARVLLVDDVLTTGATCSEAAKMLKKAGAASVAVAVVARAEGSSPHLPS